MFTFEKFIPGQSVGTDSLVIDRALFDDWVALFPDDAEIWPLMPPGMAAPVVLRSYMKLTAPRPPGNVHAGQRFEMHRLPRIGDTAVTELVCLEKRLRKGRRWLTLATTTRDADGGDLFTGRMTLIWAA